jgi:hypothetical protein
MAEYWCGSQKGWVSDKGKSVADIINAQPIILKTKWQKGQLWVILTRIVYHPTYREGNPYINGEDCPKNFVDKDGIHVLKNRRGAMIIYRGEPRNFYPQYFLLNE